MTYAVHYDCTKTRLKPGERPDMNLHPHTSFEPSRGVPDSPSATSGLPVSTRNGSLVSDRRDYHRAWYKANKARVRAKQKEWEKANADKRLIYFSKWRSDNRNKINEYAAKYRLANIESARESDRIRYHKNKDRYLAKQRERYKSNPAPRLNKCRKWRQDNKAITVQYASARRARKKSAAGSSYTTALHIAQRWAMWGGRCWLCGDKATATDHVIALNRGGAHWPSNLRPICKSCNSSKRDKPHTNFLQCN